MQQKSAHEHLHHKHIHHGESSEEMDSEEDDEEIDSLLDSEDEEMLKVSMEYVVLRVHSPLQHFDVGAGSETFCYLKKIKRQTVLVIFSQTTAPLIFVPKFIFSDTCHLYH